ncbi:hypothetical protein [Occallatibacter riparius]|uniref:Uncharacterized protein n=1 Tax=Occallatibacter riparius TaxID=1002689 RepID=A0A9J7BVD1_9BACT|nr:hypothetical protein [Occallatibacter riparius]UWZ86584.1 hypothetical protein MOP44_11710 [Occallatibacter riparius]
MLRNVRRSRSMLLMLFVCVCAAAQEPEAALQSLVTTGEVTLRGQTRQYVVRHLPSSSFPDLPDAVANELNQRGCLIPQTYQAHQPENVVHGSFQRAGSSDWAVLCSVKGTVSLLVFFDSSSKPSVLATSPETQRLQAHESTGVLGFNWGIDAASPQVVHDAQNGLSPRPARLDHDALSDSIVDRKTIYHYFADSAWSLLDMPD